MTPRSAVQMRKETSMVKKICANQSIPFIHFSAVGEIGKVEMNISAVLRRIKKIMA